MTSFVFVILILKFLILKYQGKEEATKIVFHHMNELVTTLRASILNFLKRIRVDK